MRKLAIFSWLLLFVASATARGLERVSYRDIQGQVSETTALQIKDALTRDGILAIENVPGFKQTRRSALADVEAVIAKNLDSVRTVELPDGTKRLTVGATFSAGKPRVSLVSSLLNSEVNEREALISLQSSVDDVAVKVAYSLDAALATSSAFFGDEVYHTTAGRSGESWDSFSDVMHGGSFLEHIHSYRTDQARAVDTPASVDYHTDAGLFILFAPAVYADDVYDRRAKPADFRFQDAQGGEHAIIVQQAAGNAAQATTQDVERSERGLTVHTVAPDTLVLMMGQGAVQYLNPRLAEATGRGVRAVPHALTVTEAGVRNWYGRMYLPPAEAWQPDVMSTHSALRQRLVTQAATATSDAEVQTIALPAGCGLGLPYTASQPAATTGETDPYTSYLRTAALPFAAGTVLRDCPTGEIYCWTICQPVGNYNLTCPYSEVTCVDSQGNPADPDEHNSANHPGCVGQPSVDPGGFCQGSGTDMYMQGFVSYVTGQYRTDGGSTTPACLALWFEDWVLDTKGKFAAACFGVFFLGMWTEWLAWFRRQVRVLCRPSSTAVQTVVMGVLYAVQLMFGYFCMLVAMTYQVELFVCVVLGLGLGHAAFNFKAAEVLPGGKLSEAEKILRAAADLDEVVDPCCQYLALEEDSDHNTRPATLQQQTQQAGRPQGGPNGGSARANPMH